MKKLLNSFLLLFFCCTITKSFGQTSTLGGGNIITSNISPLIMNSTPAVSNPVGTFSIVQTGSNANLTQVVFTTTGSYTTTDITAFTLYVNTLTNSLTGSTLVTSATVSASGPGTQTISLSTPFALSTSVITNYFFIVPTFAGSPVPGHTIAINSITSSNISVSAGSVSGSVPATGTITILNPAITGTTGASRCGTGTVTLAATATAGATINWYSVSTAGTSLGTGTSYITGSISSNTPYYAEASNSATIQTGTLSDNTTNLVGPYYMDQRTDLHWFSSTNACTINSVDIYPAVSGISITITMTDSTGAILATATPVAITSGQVSNTVPLTIPLGFSVPAGATKYRLGGDGTFTLTQGIYRGDANSTYGPYPMTVDGFSLVGDAGGNSTATGTSGAYTGYGARCYFYNWKLTMAATASPRSTVTATVNPIPTPTFTSSPAANLCVGNSAIYTTQTGQSSYVWSVPGVSGTDYTITSGGTGSASNTVTLTWLTTGGKIVTVNYSSAGCTGTAASSTTTVNALPVPTFTSSPGVNTCAGSSATYTTQAGQSSYVWSVPGVSGTDYTITSGGTGGTSNSVTLNWLTTGNKTVTVNYSNASGCAGASAASNTTTVNATPVPTFTSSPGANTCANSSVTYTTQAGQSSYTWSVPGVLGTNYSITSGGTGSGNNTVTLTWLTAGSKTVTVNYSNASNCAGLIAATNTTTVNALPVPTFTSSPGANTCANGSVTYTTQAGQSSYSWGVPGVSGTDYTITSGGTGGTNNTVTLTWLSTGSKTVTVNYTNASGCTAASAVSNTTTVNALPVPTFTSSSGANTCAGTNVTYTTQAGQTSYVWSVPGVSGTDYLITSGGTGGGSSTVTLMWVSGGSKTITVNYTNGVGCTGASAASSTTTVNPRPAPAFTSSPGANTCANSSVTYTTQAGQSSYAWTMPGISGTDYTITSGGTGGNTVTLSWLTTGSKTVTVNYSNSFGCTGIVAASNTTIVNPLPVPTFTSAPGINICASSVTYTTQAGQSSYTWSVPGVSGTDYTITSGGTGSGSNTVTLTWLTAGGKTVTVNYANSFGCTGASPASNTTTVISSPVPTFTAAPGVPLCANSNVTYTTQSAQFSYNWVVPGVAGIDYSITSGGIGSTDNTVTLTWLTAGAKTVTVNYANGTGCFGASAASNTTTINALPVPTFTLAPGADICANSSVTYTTLPGQTAYTWSVPGASGTDYIITSGGATTSDNSVTLTWITPGSTMVTVNYTDINGCTGISPASNTIFVNPLPAGITGAGQVCQGATITLTDGDTGGSWSGSNSSVMVDPVSGDVTGVSANTTAITYTLPTGCATSATVTVNPLPSAISANDSVCVGSVTSLFDGGGGTWTSSDGTLATIGLHSGSVTGISQGSPTITYTLLTGCMTTTTFTVNPLPSAIAGTTNVCAGSTTNLNDPDINGNWTSSNTFYATVDFNSGVVSGVNAGTPGITYTLPTGCKVTAGITVNPSPAAISGVSNVCVGSAITLIDGTSGGVWTTSDATLASVTGGVVTGIGQGTPAITYTLPAGCYKTKSITVNPLPSAIEGAASVCIGATISLSDPDGGGAWSSSNALIAIVGGSTGTVTGFTAGAPTIAYTLGTGCSTHTVVTVNPVPLPITGANTVCLGATAVLADVTTGGSWTSTDGTGAASVDGVSGMVTGDAPGNATITYTRLGCSVTKNIVVNPLPASIIGTAYLCATATTTLTDAITGGTWSSSNTALATINLISGVVSGLSAGVPNISYKLPTGCYTTVTATINPLPTVYTVIGGGSYCAGAAGLHVGLSGSQSGVNYQLFYGVTLVGAPLPGTGAALDFGVQTLAEIYTVIANNGATSCSINMAGAAPVVTDPLPVVYSVTGGGHYCSSGTGVHIGLDGSASGINYQLYNGGIAAGGPVGGISGPLDLGLETAVGTYTVIARNPVTTCTVNMVSSATVIIDPTVVPALSISTGVGDIVCAGNLITITATAVNGGATPIYSWSLNGIPVPVSGSSYTYIPSDGDHVSLVLASSAPCPSPATVSSSLSLSVLANGAPGAHISISPNDTVCQGSLVELTATSTFGGTAPSFSWVVNSSIMGSGTSFSYIPLNHDAISCILSSNYQCRTADSGTSNTINMQVQAAINPTVFVTANPNATISPGEAVNFTTSIDNGGPDPSYQWYVNGLPVSGADFSSYYNSNPADGDSVSCVVTSNGICSGLTGSGFTKIHITRVGVQQVISVGNDIRLVPNPNKGVFTVKGTLGSPGYEEVTLMVTDMLGQVVYSNTVTAQNGILNEPVLLNNNLANGMYLLNVHSGGENAVFHFVIEK